MSTQRKRSKWRCLAAPALCALGLALVVGLGERQARARADCAGIAIEPAAQRVLPGRVVTVAVVISSPQQLLQGVDAYLDFDPLYLQVVDALGNPATTVEPGTTLPVILQNRANNALGQIGYSAGIALGTPAITGTFTLATLHLKCIRPIRPEGTTVAFAFDREHNRYTEVAYRGMPVLGVHTDGALYPYPTLILPVIWKHHYLR